MWDKQNNYVTIHFFKKGACKAPTRAREELRDLFILWHVLDGSIDLLSDIFNCILPFQVTVTSIHQPVCRHKVIHYQHLWTGKPLLKNICCTQMKELDGYFMKYLTYMYYLPKSLLVCMSIGRF